MKIETVFPTRLDRYLKRLYPELTQGAMQKALRSGDIKLNSKKTKSHIRITNNDELFISKYFLDNNIMTHACNKDLKFSSAEKELSKKICNEYLVYQDNNIIVINKPSGIATQGGSKISVSIDRAIKCLKQDFRLVHRLDKDTSGALIIAKHYAAAYSITKALYDKVIEKKYIAMVHSIPDPSAGEISSVINKNQSDTKVNQNQYNVNKGKLAITKYQVLEKLDNFSLIEFIPITGRMHQLRIHAMQLGCPILGDKKYNSNQYNTYKMMLHAKSIKIPQCIFGYEITVEINLPSYFNLL